MYSKCDHCGEYAVDDSENVEVCKSCGVVVEEMKFSNSEYVPVTRSFVPFTRSEARFHNQKRKPTSLLHGQNVLNNLCHVNNISSIWKAEITELFKLVFAVRRFYRKEDAGATAACCLFLLLRKNKQAIPISTLCKQVPCTRRKFSFFLNFLKSCLSTNEKFKQYAFILDNSDCGGQKKDDENVPDIVSSLIHEICEKAEAEERTKFMEKTTSLVKLAYSCWLFTGRSPRSIVTASAFLCWKSMHLMQMKIPFTSFCRRFETHVPAAKRRIPELKAVLLKLGKMIPSHTEDYINKNNVLFHLNTILEHSETLRNDLFPDSYTWKEVDTVEFSSFRYPVNNHPRKEPSDAVHYDSDMNASDIEISDSEIESYLVPNKTKVIEFCGKKNINKKRMQKMFLKLNRI